MSRPATADVRTVHDNAKPCPGTRGGHPNTQAKQHQFKVCNQNKTRSCKFKFYLGEMGKWGKTQERLLS